MRHGSDPGPHPGSRNWLHLPGGVKAAEPALAAQQPLTCGVRLEHAALGVLSAGKWILGKQAGSLRLQWIYQSSQYATSTGKYSSKVDLTENNFSLNISNVQRNDSGVYYCGLSASVYVQPNFGNGTRLIVTGEFAVGQNNDIAMLAGAVKNSSPFFARL
uniref:Ig-like domain-containing protein n=1 Tax=Gopherus agassizii TaxID=38772 RepID=A0A452H9Q8_9SAUR